MISSKIFDFIGQYEPIFNEDECKEFINYFNTINGFNLVIDHTKYSQTPSHMGRKDSSIFMLHPDVLELPSTAPIVQKFVEKFWACYNDYISEFTVLQGIGKVGLHQIRFQKTPVGGGFHAWHFENFVPETNSRILVFQVYLNDVEEGGETEFLYQSTRVEPKAGRLLIWPAGYTHTHRGNPPLSNDKFIMTGWISSFGES
jgi:hypothetical protein